MKNFNNIVELFTEKYQHKDFLGNPICKHNYVVFRAQSKLEFGIVLHNNEKTSTIGYITSNYKSNESFEKCAKRPDEIFVTNDDFNKELKAILLEKATEKIIKEYTKVITCVYHNKQTNECGFYFMRYTYSRNNSNKAFAAYLSTLTRDENIDLYVMNKSYNFVNINQIKALDIHLRYDYIPYDLENVYLPVINEDLTKHQLHFSNQFHSKTFRDLEINRNTTLEKIIVWLPRTKVNKWSYWNRDEYSILKADNINEVASIGMHYEVSRFITCKEDTSKVIEAWNILMHELGLFELYGKKDV